MTFPGPNRTHSSARRARSLPSERLMLARPTCRPTLAQVMADALQIDVTAHQAGYADGAAARIWDPGNRDLLSYASGYAAGAQFGRRRS